MVEIEWFRCGVCGLESPCPKCKASESARQAAESRTEAAEKEAVTLRQRMTDMADAERLIAWMDDPQRQPAHTAFTAGPERQIAYRVEGLLAKLAVWDGIIKEGGRENADLRAENSALRERVERSGTLIEACRAEAAKHDQTHRRAADLGVVGEYRPCSCWLCKALSSLSSGPEAGREAFYHADGSFEMLPAEQVKRLRIACAAVVEEAKQHEGTCDGSCTGTSFAAALSRLRAEEQKA